ncbi:MAG TPA: GlsB/YeaQ/YmgE family stress response membrane protein [Methylomirabilota bacterium]|nr:GlsB/YeaQ/YmgE family stress response membrane protein [Methylomirabilota bacterium]
MAGVGFLGTIIIGLLAGWLASRFTKSDTGLIGNLVLGVIGAVVFGWLAGTFQIVVVGWLANFIGGTIGAVLLITLYRAVRKS